LQQVGSKVFLANAQAVDPRTLPVPVQARSPVDRMTRGFGRVWVLHRQVVRRTFWALGLAGLAGVVFAAHEPIGVVFGSVGTLAQQSVAQAGFSVGAIEITGQTLTDESAVLAALALDPTGTTLGFDAAAARDRIAELPAVEAVTVRKIYPADVVVEITERVPVARWRVDGVTFVVDDEGSQIGEDDGSYGALPLIIGDGAADDAMVMIRSLRAYPDLTASIAALSRIADRRWDLIFETGLRVQMPEFGVAQALRNLERYQRDYALLDRDVTIVDLRVPHLVSVRPTVREEEDSEE
jgi:cell division protein FtsQ